MKSLLKPLVLAVSVASLSFAAQAANNTNVLDLNFGKDTFRAHFDKNGFGKIEKLYSDVGWLHHTDNGDMAEFGVHAVGKSNHSDKTYLGVGAKLHYIHDKRSSDNYAGVGVGGLFRYAPSFATQDSGFVGSVKKGLSYFNFSGYAYYVPSAMAFSDLDNLINAGFSVNYDIIENASINVGYRYAGVKVEDFKRTKFDSNAFVGFSLSF